jgi:hypothetical protein
MCSAVSGEKFSPTENAGSFKANNESGFSVQFDKSFVLNYDTTLR